MVPLVDSLSETRMSFPCISCGACCRRIHELSPEVLRLWGLDIDEKGACVFLDGNKCSIYETRPAICRIDSMLEVYGYDRDEYYRWTAEVCNEMLAAEGSTEKVSL